MLHEIVKNKSERFKILIEALNLEIEQQRILEEILKKAVGLFDIKLGLKTNK